MDPAQKVVLTVEDVEDVRLVVVAALQGRGYRILEAETLAMGASLFLQRRPDLVVLDIGLPDGSGIDLCRKIRAHPELAATPVIMLTAREDFDSKQEGVQAGADQYLVKPVDRNEMLLWVEELLKRKEFYAGNSDRLEVGPLVIDIKARLVRYGPSDIGDLTAREFDLLYALVKRRPQVLSRSAILKQVWRTIAVDNIVDTHLSHLRRKLPHELADRLQTVPGKGFRFMA